MLSLFALFLLVAAGLVAAMTLAWLVQRLTRNAGWVDAIWSLATGLGGIACALIVLPGEAGIGPRQWLVAGLTSIWSVRLASHIAARTAGRPEDVRYAGFRRDWGSAFERRMFGFLMIQAAAASLLTLSILVAARNPAPELLLGDWLGVIILAMSIGGEAVADTQMQRFRKRGEKDAVCEVGLWGWSRHPNYFFEFLGWCAYPFVAINWSGGWWPGWFALTGPVFMFWLLRYVSGVPPLETAMLASRGDRFRDYQRRVSIFIPLPPHQ